MNKEAIKYRGTSIPGIKKCSFWEEPVSEDHGLPITTNDIIKLFILITGSIGIMLLIVFLFQ